MFRSKLRLFLLSIAIIFSASSSPAVFAQSSAAPQPGIKASISGLQVSGDQITGTLALNNPSDVLYPELYYTIALYTPGVTKVSSTNGKATQTTSKGLLVSYKRDRFDIANKAKADINFSLAYNKKLQAGNYSFNATIETSDGQILGTSNATQALQTDSSGYVIDPLSCGVFVNGISFNGAEGPIVKPADKAYVECSVEALNKSQSVSSQVSYGIDYSSRDIMTAGKEGLKNYIGNEKVLFNPGEKKNLRFIVPAVETPQVYQGYVYLIDTAGNKVSASVPFRWIVPGPSSFIQSINTDKDTYKKDETIKASILAYPSMDLYWQGRVTNFKAVATGSASLDQGTSMVGAKLKITVSDRQTSVACGSKEIDLPEAKTAESWPMQAVEITSTRDCASPIVKAEVTYQNQTLASLSKSMPLLVSPEVIKKQTNNRLIWGAIVVAIIAVIAGVMIYRKRNKTKGSAPKDGVVSSTGTSGPSQSPSIPVSLIIGASVIIGSGLIMNPGLVIGQSATPSASLSPTPSPSPWSCQVNQGGTCPSGYSCQSSCGGGGCDTNNGFCQLNSSVSPSPSSLASASPSASSSATPSATPIASGSAGLKPPINNPLDSRNIQIKRGFINALGAVIEDNSYINYTNFVQVDPAGSSSIITDPACGPVKLKLVGFSTNEFVCDNKKAGIRYIITIDGKPAQLLNVTSPDSSVTISSVGSNSFDVWEVAGTRTADLDATLVGGIKTGNHKIDIKVIGLGLTDMQHNNNFYSAVFSSVDNLSNRASLSALYPTYPGFPMDWSALPAANLNNCGITGECYGNLSQTWSCESTNMCNETCSSDEQCSKATDGCNTCTASASGTKTCQTPPACNASCKSSTDCQKSVEGCTSCIPNDAGTASTCKPTPVCGAACTSDVQCAEGGCSSCVGGVCKPPPACGTSCTTKADCSGVKDNCSECLEGSCTDYSDSMCKCDGIVADMTYPSSAFKFQAFGKIDGKDAQKADIADVTFRMTKDNQVIAKSNPITPKIVQNDPTKVRFEADWQTTPPAVTKNSTYRVFADVRCKPKKITADAGQIFSPAPAPVWQMTPKGLELAINAVDKLFGSSNEQVNKATSKLLTMFSTSTVQAQGTNLQLQTLNFVKLMDTDNCRFVMFKYDESLF